MSAILVSQMTDTVPVTGIRAISPHPINFGADWRVVSESASEVILTNIGNPLDSPEQIRIAWSEIPDVFKGTKYVAPTAVKTKGTSVLIQLTGGLKSSDDPVQTIFPYSAHLVLKVPNGPSDMDAAGINNILSHLLGTLYDTKATEPDSRIESILHGALTPPEI